jgi:gliding motility-associated-like protein
MHMKNTEFIPKLRTLVALFVLVFSSVSFSQTMTTEYGNFSPCSGPIALYIYDFTTTENNTLSQSGIGIQNSDNECCTEPTNAGCLFFHVYIDPNATGVQFQQSGAGGNVDIYYANCSSIFPANTNICLNPANALVDADGKTYHRFMFCRSGNTLYTFTFVQIPSPSVSPDIITAVGCTQTLTSTGLTNPVWTSISPGAPGTYNSNLSCTNCATTVFTPNASTPSTVVYEVSGTISGSCAASTTWTGQVSVTTFPTLFAVPGPDVGICNGSVLGATVTASALGGTAPYRYSWTGPNGFTQINTHNSTDDNITVLQPGVYTVVITDGTGCPSATTSVTVVAFDVDIVANPGNPATFCGTPTPTINLNGSVAGTNTGIWSGGGGSFNPNTTTLNATYTPNDAEIAAGSVTLTLTPTNTFGCPSTPNSVTFTLTNFESILTLDPSNVSCFGGNDGEIDLTITGGFDVNSILWSNGATTEDITNLIANTYEVTVTDVNGCVGTESVVITEPTALSGSITAQTNVSCFGGNNGSVTVAGSGATPEYSYSIDGGTTYQVGGTFSGLIAGDYTITIRDSEGCLFTVPVTITEPIAPLEVVLDNQTNVACFEGNNGAINVTTSGGTPNYTFVWTTTDGSGLAPGQEDQSGLTAGTYELTVTDANFAISGQAGCTATFSVTITEPLAPLEVVLDNQTNVACFGGSNGAIDVTTSGGTPNYTFVWTTTDGSGLAPGQEDQSGLTAGTYELTVTDANFAISGQAGCTATFSVTITEPLAPLEVVLDNQTNVACFEGNNGAINVTTSGGTPNYTFVWTTTDGSGLAPGDENQNGLTAGTYELTVTDANFAISGQAGCIATLSVTITEPLAPLEVVLDNQTNVACFGGNNGAIDVTTSGGTPNYTFVWTTTDGSGLAPGDENQSGLTAGTYELTVTDENFAISGQAGCTATFSVTITEPLAPLEVVLDNQTNVACFEGNNGAINVTTSGGTPNYTFVWTTTDGSGLAPGDENQNGLTAGTYELTVTDENFAISGQAGCIATLSVTITEPLAPLEVVLDNQTNVACFGGNNGAINVTTSGGTPNYTFVWTTTDGSGLAPGDENQSGLTAGTYELTVTDANFAISGQAGCIATLSVTITEPLAPLEVVLDNQTNVACFGGNNGAIDVTTSGGTPNYTFVWTTTDGSGLAPGDENQSGLTAGTYELTVTDENFAISGQAGCTATFSVTITEPLAPLEVVLDNQTNVACFEGNNGAINVTTSGGTPNYTFVWTTTDGSGLAPGQEDQSGLTAGTYELTATDANFAISGQAGCIATLSVTITEPLAPLEVVLDNQTNVACFGGNNGAINVTTSGGTPNYTFVWTTTDGSGLAPGQEDQSGLTAGTYELTVTDANFAISGQAGCIATLSVTITEPLAPLEVVLDNQTNVACFEGNNGAINVTTSGGTPNYTFVWTTTDGSGLAPGQEDQSGLTAGTYELTVTDANFAISGQAGCTATFSVTITEPLAPLEVVLDNQTNVACFGGSNGAIDVTTSGGTPNYTFVWTTTDGSGLAPGDENQSGLTAGTYELTVTDANFAISGQAGCTATFSVTITEPLAPLEVVLDNQTNVACFGGSNGAINVTTSGGTPNYTFVWTTTDGSGLAPGQENQSGLTAGTYELTVTDDNFAISGQAGCTATFSVTITEPLAPLEVVLDNQTNVACFGGSNGAINVTNSGGTPNYTFVWTTTDGSGLAPGDENQSGLTAGTYELTVTDENFAISGQAGCTATFSVTITEPLAPLEVVLDNQTNVACFEGNNGAINVTTSGGTPNYTFVWTTTDGSGLAPGDENQSGLTAGTYELTATDANFAISGQAGCIATLSVTITEPELLEIESMIPSIFDGGFNLSGCDPDGSIDLTVIGGTPNYTFAWSNGAITEDLSDLIAGTYEVIVTDANGCTTSQEIELTEPSGLDSEIDAFTFPSGSNISCFGFSDGRIFLDVTGGAGGYTFEWSNGATTQNLINVPVGSYSVIIRDANGCSVFNAITLIEPTPLTEDISAFEFAGGWNVSCIGASDGSINLIPSGGSPTYFYNWNTGATSQNISNIPAGDYEVTITDINGCEIISSITLNEPPALGETISASTYVGGWNISCFGASDGEINLEITGGTPSYTYLWSNGATTQNLVNVAAGTYSVTATDANGCQITSEITLSEPPAMTETISAQTFIGGWNVTCNGATDGTIDVTIGGGTPGYTYLWSNGALSEDISNVGAGFYEVTATDANGCEITTSIILLEPETLNVAPSITSNYNGFDVSCNGSSDGSLLATGSGGTLTYTYSWTNANGQVVSTTAIANGLSAGTYNVLITDANGCRNNSPITITEPDPLTSSAFITSDFNGEDVSCFNATDGTASANASGGAPNYSFVWTNSSNIVVGNNQNLSNVGAGTYNVTITDANGCVITDRVTLSQPTAVQSVTSVTSNFNGQDVSCHNAQDGSISVSGSGGVPGYAYFWTNSAGQTIANSADVNNLGSGTYNVTVIDINGCISTNTIVVSEPPPLFSSLDALTNYFGMPVSCVDQEDGIIQVTFGGGTATYNIVWQQFPDNNTNTASNLGVGQYSVTIFDINGCQISSEITLDAHPLPLFAPGSPIRACFGDLIEINCFTQPANSVVWSFSNGLTGTSCQPNPFTANWVGCIDANVTITSQFGCRSQFSYPEYVCIEPLPNASFFAEPSTPSFITPNTYFTNTSTGAVSYEWNFGDGSPLVNLTNVQHTFPETGPGQYNVTLVAISDYGCVDTFVMPIFVRDELVYFVPNAFTPDGDQHNNTFKPIFYSGWNPFDYTLLIFNRWGEVIFESRNSDVGWDGTYAGIPVQDGVYIWKIIVGHSYNADRTEKIGHVTLLR